MNRIVSIGSVRRSGASTLALTLGSVLAAAGIPVTLVDAAAGRSLMRWAERDGCPEGLAVAEADDEASVERLMRAARRRGEALILDCGTDAAIVRTGARLSDMALVPVQFSQLSVCAAVLTDGLLRRDEGTGTPGRQRAFVASAVCDVPAAIALAIEEMIEESPTPRLGVGLAERAAYERPFREGGTIFTRDAGSVGLDRARAEAAMLAYEIGLLGSAGWEAESDRALALAA